MNYEQKYLKYKAKYLALKSELEGAGLFYITAGDKIRRKDNQKTGRVSKVNPDGTYNIYYDNIDEEVKNVPKDEVERNNRLAKVGRFTKKATADVASAAAEAAKAAARKSAELAAVAARKSAELASATASATSSALRRTTSAARAGINAASTDLKSSGTSSLELNNAVNRALLSSDN